MTKKILTKNALEKLIEDGDKSVKFVEKKKHEIQVRVRV
jgi:hypothetical protein